MSRFTTSRDGCRFRRDVFRMLMVGYFEDIGSQRGIEWRCADSLSLMQFLGCAIHDATPEHSSLTRITERLPLEVYREANAAMKSIVRKESGENWLAHLKALAAERIEISSRADAAWFDKQRAKKGKKKCSNDGRQSPSDPDARVAKMKDGSTHLAYKAENAVDLDTEAITAAEIFHADQSDSSTLEDTLRFAAGQIAKVTGEGRTQEAVVDKGYLKN